MPHLRHTHIFVPSLCSLALIHTECVFFILFKRFTNSYHTSRIVTLQLKNAAIWRIEMMQLVDNCWYGYSCYQGLESPHSQCLNTACKTKSLLCHEVYVCLFVYVWERVVSINWSLLKKLQNKPKGPQRENMRT